MAVGTTVTLHVSDGPAASCAQLGTPAVGLSGGTRLVTVDESGRLGGFEIELIGEILRRICAVDAEFVALTASERFLSIATGETDLTMTSTSFRQLEGAVTYTTPYILLESEDGELQPQAIAVASRDPVFKQDLDRALVRLIDDGTWEELHLEHVGELTYDPEQMLGVALPDG